MIQVYKIDEQGFYEYETYFVDEPNEFEITTPCNTCEENTFYKPQWKESEWIEGFTEEEILEWQEANRVDENKSLTQEQMLIKLIINQL